MNKPSFKSLPYSVRLHFADNWSWDYDGYETGRDEIVAEVAECREGLDIRKQLDAYWENTTISLMVERAKECQSSLECQLEELKEFIKEHSNV
jgi:hypothetical protein